MKSTWLVSLTLFLPLICLAGIEAEKIAEGEQGDNLAWSIYQVRSGSDGKDVNLMVVLHNTGEKSIELEGIDSSSFSLTTKEGNDLEIQSATGFKVIPSGGFVIGHLTIKRLGEVGQISDLRLELKELPNVGVAFVANGLQFDARSRVAQIVDGLGHMAYSPAEILREQERIEELQRIDSVAALLWAYIKEKIQMRSVSHIGISNGLGQLAVVPGGRDYKEPIKELVQKHNFKIGQLRSHDILSKEQKLELGLSESIVASGIRYFREPEDFEFILPFLKSPDPSIVSHSISWMAGYAGQDAIVILENYAKSEGLPDYKKDRVINAIRNIERRFSLPIRPPRTNAPSAGGAP